jgi:tRNA 2-thiouridine synthesizing protein E
MDDGHVVDSGARLARIEALLEQLQLQSAAQLDEQRRVRDMVGEAWDEAMPIGRAVMGAAITRLERAEARGWMRLAGGLAAAADQVAESTPPEELAQLGPRLVRLLQATDALTQPEVLDVLVAAADQLRAPEALAPIGVTDLVRISREEDVQRGVAVLVELLRGLGRAGRQLGEQAPRAPRAVAPLRAPAAAPGHLRAPEGAARPAAAPTGADPAAELVFEGLRFRADGTLLQPEGWTEALAEKLAPTVGVPSLTAQHWVVIRFARAEHARTGQTPNIRRIAAASGVGTKELFALFPTAPARAVARVSGLPKPVGCV